MTAGKCAACPIASGPCRAVADGRYAYLCRLAATGRPAAIATIRAASDGTATMPPPPEERPTASLGFGALLAAIRSCPDAGPASCGCSPMRRCARLGRDVALRECLSCDLAAEPAARSEGDP